MNLRMTILDAQQFVNKKKPETLIDFFSTMRKENVYPCVSNYHFPNMRKHKQLVGIYSLHSCIKLTKVTRTSSLYYTSQNGPLSDAAFTHSHFCH